MTDVPAYPLTASDMPWPLWFDPDAYTRMAPPAVEQENPHERGVRFRDDVFYSFPLGADPGKRWVWTKSEERGRWEFRDARERGDPLPVTVPAPMPGPILVGSMGTNSAPRQAPRPIPQRDAMRAAGFTGDACPDCGQFMMVRNGTCLKCQSCGATTGCS